MGAVAEMDWLEQMWHYWERRVPNNPTPAIMVLTEVLVLLCDELAKHRKGERGPPEPVKPTDPTKPTVAKCDDFKS